MSFWKRSPGPSWWDCIESFNPCRDGNTGICNNALLHRERANQLPKGFRLVQLNEKYASFLEVFLKEHFSLYPSCRINLSKERIREGFLEDGWIGVGITTETKQLVGCCISKSLGHLKFSQELLKQSGLVDYFCVHQTYRGIGLAHSMLEELVFQTAKQGRIVHLFYKEGFPIWSIPPIYTGRYLVRAPETPGDSKEYFGSAGIATHYDIHNYSHAEYLPLTNFIANLPHKLSGDSELFVFNYKGHIVFLCMTDIHHISVPEGKIIGELSWMLPQTPEVPLSIQKLAVETCVDCSKFDLILMDAKIPHTNPSWKRDASYSLYIFNYNPGGFFTIKPFLVL
jgi:GNAT superfamily N-acetyltransferase